MKEEIRNNIRNFHSKIDGIYREYVSQSNKGEIEKANNCHRELERINDWGIPQEKEIKADFRKLLSKYKASSMDENTANQFLGEVKKFNDEVYGIANSYWY